MRYKELIEELRVLRDQGAALFDRPDSAWDRDFRRWRSRLEARIEAIQRQGYPAPCNVDQRRFFKPGAKEPAESVKAYNRKLQDTLDEIDAIIARYERFGKPRERPGRATLAGWLRSSPFLLKLKLLLMGVLLFLLGVVAARFTALDEVLLALLGAP